MKTTTQLLAFLLTPLIAAPALSQTQAQTADHAHTAEQPLVASAIDVEEGAEAAVAVTDAFGAALAAGDFQQVEALLDPAVIVLETGAADRSRSEYLGHHARADAAFLAGSHSTLTSRIARVEGGTAWVASESELHASRDGKQMTLLSTETMVLGNTPTGWKIVHIHWSSRPKKS